MTEIAKNEILSSKGSAMLSTAWAGSLLMLKRNSWYHLSPLDQATPLGGLGWIPQPSLCPGPGIHHGQSTASARSAPGWWSRASAHPLSPGAWLWYCCQSVQNKWASFPAGWGKVYTNAFYESPATSSLRIWWCFSGIWFVCSFKSSVSTLWLHNLVLKWENHQKELTHNN